ncbi:MULTISPECIES: DUF2322 family protein [Comamonas]|jgi:hypothetical protein|uniref:DUF2322 family protein n=1 Tax=Comamonas TaxID=283 RepID=UPI0012CF5668|nr:MULTISPECIES: DUF2322 family protein [Comamonas]MDR3065002.1 DUF2322 family protein [Comamonas sp.]MEB5965197.1 DUF2322 family protein [Comamonas testosteroni]MPS94078.1 DUF2322 family protein [Comamonas sp.]
MAFADNLKQLPSIDHISELQLIDPDGNLSATVPNAPGKAGSVKVYHALFAKYGSINVAAAEEGLQLFAEHTEDAKARPGAHPNIDRLLEVIASGKGYDVTVIEA